MEWLLPHGVIRAHRTQFNNSRCCFSILDGFKWTLCSSCSRLHGTKYEIISGLYIRISENPRKPRPCLQLHECSYFCASTHHVWNIYIVSLCHHDNNGTTWHITLQWKSIWSTAKKKCGVPQGLILGLLLYLIYISDLFIVCKKTETVLFADDSNQFLSGSNAISLQYGVNNDLKIIAECLKVIKLSLHMRKTHFMCSSAKIRLIHVYFNKLMGKQLPKSINQILGCDYWQ